MDEPDKTIGLLTVISILLLSTSIVFGIAFFTQPDGMYKITLKDGTMTYSMKSFIQGNIYNSTIKSFNGTLVEFSKVDKIEYITFKALENSN